MGGTGGGRGGRRMGGRKGWVQLRGGREGRRTLSTLMTRGAAAAAFWTALADMVGVEWLADEGGLKRRGRRVEALG
jgi:hypothetical protein